MPHFENIDNYEATHPKSGRKKIVPIAPHSMQASDYRPRHRERPVSEKPKKKDTQFDGVQIEPISVRQMEKEFKQAARKESRRQSKANGGWLASIRKAIASLFGKKEADKPVRRKSQRRPRRSQPSGKGKGESGQTELKSDAGQKSPARRSRRRRSRSGQKGPQQGQRQGSSGDKGQGPSQKRSSRGNQSDQSAKGGGDGAPKKRRRRSRRPAGKGPQNRNDRPSPKNKPKGQD